jgi:predicted CoA-binding protein
MSWEENLVGDPQGIAEILRDLRVVAVLGMELEKNAVRPAYAVPKFLRQRGYEVVPLPVKYADVTEVDGLRAYHSLSEVPQDIDIVDVFRLPRDIPKHLDDILARLCGFSPAFATTPWPKRLPGRGSRSCRTAV